MVVKNTISRDNESELSVQMFSEAADDIATCSDELLLVAEALAQSCLDLPPFFVPPLKLEFLFKQTVGA